MPAEYLEITAASPFIEEGEKLPKSSAINDLTLEEDDEDVASEYNLDNPSNQW